MKKNLSQIALFDMDETLCNHYGKLKRDYQKIKSPNEPTNFYDNISAPHIKERIRLIRNQSGWWRDLEPLQLGFDILEVARDLGFYVSILTKGPGSCDNAWTEKKQWIEKHVGKVGLEVGMSIVTDKSLVYGKFLVDDYPSYQEAWLNTRPRGIGIMPAQPHNKDFKHERVLRYDGINLEQVKDAMVWTRDRNGPAPKF